MNFNVVPIEEEHIEAFWEALDSVARERKYLTFFEGPPIETTRYFVRNMLKDNWPQVVALDKGRVIGWCDIQSLNRPIFPHVGELAMGVVASHRGHGVGTALIKAALEKAKKKGLTRIELAVRENNEPALALYRKFGFVAEGLHINAACVDGEYENHVSMALLYSK
ncbi:MAG: GNAT family N-acetyltransferase [Gammaproteobacteria bacterium]|nr:GNAT family N-acetyltransferase [Gammaproteobacteria bacterium]MCH9763687.1 GNAT family N-acetyltransferase [Gammaproteobacteria bacterium]